MLCESTNNEKLYTKQNGKIICNHCGKECKKYQEKSLVLEIKDETIIPSICPLFLEKEMKEAAKALDFETAATLRDAMLELKIELGL